MSNVIVEDLDLTPEQVFQVIRDHAARGDVERMQREEKRAFMEVQRRREKQTKALNDHIQLQQDKTAILMVIAKRLAQEQRDAEIERMRNEPKTPFMKKVADFWEAKTAPKAPASIRLFA